MSWHMRIGYGGCDLALPGRSHSEHFLSLSPVLSAGRLGSSAETFLSLRPTTPQFFLRPTLAGPLSAVLPWCSVR